MQRMDVVIITARQHPVRKFFFYETNWNYKRKVTV